MRSQWVVCTLCGVILINWSGASLATYPYSWRVIYISDDVFGPRTAHMLCANVSSLASYVRPQCIGFNYMHFPHSHFSFSFSDTQICEVPLSVRMWNWESFRSTRTADCNRQSQTRSQAERHGRVYAPTAHSCGQKHSRDFDAGIKYNHGHSRVCYPAANFEFSHSSTPPWRYSSLLREFYCDRTRWCANGDPPDFRASTVGSDDHTPWYSRHDPKYPRRYQAWI